MESSSNDGNVNSALQTLQDDQKLRTRAAAKIHNVDHMTLTWHRTKISSQCDARTNSMKLTKLKEVIFKHILNL